MKIYLESPSLFLFLGSGLSSGGIAAIVITLIILLGVSMGAFVSYFSLFFLLLPIICNNLVCHCCCEKLTFLFFLKYIWRVQQQRSQMRTGLHGSQSEQRSGFENVGFNAASETVETS
jgi:hypothetical protein